MDRIVRTGRWALLATAIVIGLLLAPWNLPQAGALWDAAGNSLHVVLFAALAWLWRRGRPGPGRGWRLWLALALLAAALEWLQGVTGRTPRLGDWLLGAGGAAGCCWTWDSRRLRRIRWAALLALVLVPPAWVGALTGLESRAFPWLVDPAAAWSRRGWTLTGVRLAPAAGPGLRLERDPPDGDQSAPYPGAFRRPACGDWRGAAGLRAELFWPPESSAVLAIRVDDREGNPPYAERFQREFTVTQGWNLVEIPAAELRQTPGGHPLALAAVRQWGVFLVSDMPFDYFLIGPVRLVMPKETP